MKKIAFVTYNRIGDGQCSNGMIAKGKYEIYIAQNEQRSKWSEAGEEYEDRQQTRRRLAGSVTRALDLKDMDHIFLYVGAEGGEEAIRQTKEIDSEKITYVMCDCNYSKKKKMIKNLGNAKANIIGCECGGRETLEKILYRTLG